MKFLAAAAFLASLAASVNAHARTMAIFVNGVDQGDGMDVYIRSPPNNSPLKDLTSTDLTCNVGGGIPAPKTIEVKAGDVVTFEWHHDSRTDSDDIIDPSHKGPVLVYMAPSDSNGIGNVWVKIFDEAFKGSSWAVDKLIAARGKHSVVIPDVAPKEYLLRPELLTLHEADTLFTENPNRGNQLYMSCVQIKVVSSGKTTLPSGIAIPGNYKDTSPGIKFNLYDGTSPSTYVSPGGAVWEGAAGGAIGTIVATNPKPSSSSSSVAQSTSRAASTSSSSASKTTVVSSAKFTTSKATTTSTPTKPTSTPTKPSSTSVCSPATTSAVAGVAQIYQQCGGIGFNGPTSCASGTKCQKWNDWYHQCTPA
ncbi:hypothetical protein FRC03_007447 [Tulasnella sp. 419]|nr:hypothetical protein FRC03_007447 [Tulasnella sp. 419]